METDITDSLRTMIANEMDVILPIDQIDSQTSLFDDGLRLDSFAIVELITMIEAQFKLEFSDADLQPEHFRNLGTLAELIVQRKNEVT